MAVVDWNPTAEEYHADTERQSRSMVYMYRNNPAKYHAQYVAKTLERDPPTPEMITGSLSHLFILEPERLKTDVVVIPESVLAKNGAKSTNAYRDFAAEHDDKIIVKQAEFDLARRIVDAVREDSQVRGFKLLEGGEAERTIVWQDGETGLMCKGRFDYSKPGLIVDVKTTDDVSPEAFSNKAAKLGYDFQDCFYRLGAEAADGKMPLMVFIAVSKTEPISVACHDLNQEFRDVAFADVRRTLNALANSIQFDDWLPDYRKQINTIAPPLWRANSYRWRIEP